MVGKTLLLLLSHSCNLNCRYCYEWHKDSRKMTWQQICSILEKEILNGVEEIESIDLLGGEPLVNFEMIPKLCEWVWNHSPNTKIFSRTNGMLLTNSMKEWFNNNKSLFTLGLSIDGFPEVNAINRGRGVIDLYYFLENWPDNPVKMTIFPDSVNYLYESVLYLYKSGANLIGGLAQGVEWNTDACVILGEELSKLTNYYLENDIEPLDPLYDLHFEKGFWIPSEDVIEEPCWKQANIHAYDCDGELLPCHMFSVIVQGREKRKTILHDASAIESEQLPAKCISCPIRWCCKNCMAMNYQHTGQFGANINLKLMCEAQKVAAQASAEYIVGRFGQLGGALSKAELDAVPNAIRYLKLRYSNG